jgi:hypothetical protein
MKLKKFLSLLLALVMTASLLIVPAHAEDAGAEEGGTGTTVNFTNVAPLVKADSTSAANAIRKAPLLTAGLTDETADPEPIIGESPDGLEMDKRIISVNQDGSYTIQLEAYTTGSVTSVDTTKPTDIIAVIDQSGSMAQDMTSYTYNEVYSLKQSQTYYVQRNGSYIPVTWCSNCKAWTNGCGSILFWHDSGTSYTPKTSAADTATDHVQFYTRGGATTTTRLDALRAAMTNFADSVAEKAAGADKQLGTDDDVDHRIAIVGFSSDVDTYQNTELLTGVDITTGSRNYGKDPVTNISAPYYYPTGYVKNGAQYGNITSNQYAKALQSMKLEPGRTSVTNAIGALTARGGTETLDGLTMAENILKNSDGTDRTRVVILFTDGDTDSYRDDVVNKANSLKNTYGATVYTVGIFEGANGKPPITKDTSEANALMHRVSSNYPNATASRTTGFFGGINYQYNDGDFNPNLKGDDSYYLSAKDADALNDIFQKISQQVSESSMDLGSTTQIKDVVSPYFTMPANTSDVTVKAVACTGYANGEPTWANNGAELTNAVTIDPAKRTVTVSKFDFQHNFVAENGRDESDAAKPGNFYGRKLVITFTVKPQEGFWGGNNVPTNGADSGIYKDDGTKVGTFDVPTVNVPLNVPDLTAENKNIYLLGTTPAASDLGTFPVPTGEDAWKTAYVDIGSLEMNPSTISNTEDTTGIKLSVTVEPKYTGANAEGTPAGKVTKTATAKVDVFTPELTYQDSTAYYGETVSNDYSGNFVSEVWKHGDTVSTSVTMFGVKPTLDLTYTADSTKLNGNKYGKNDVPVKVGVKIGNEDVTAYTKFVHTDCASDCGWTTLNPANGDPAFLIHIKTCTLSITKAGGASDETYVFDVYKDGAKYSEVTIQGNGTEKLVELPVGTYTIQEDTGWSWRFTADNGTGAELNRTTPTGEITCTNTKTTNQWLNGFSQVIQNIFGVAKH